MKTILTALLFLFAAVGARAQAPIGVAVGGDNSDSQTVANQLKAKIGGTSRYAVYDSSGSEVAQLTVDVTCVVARNAGGLATGYACDSDVSFFPPEMRSLSVHLSRAGQVVTCPLDGAYCAEALFEAFVNGTQPDKLATAKSQLQRDVDDYIQSRQAKKEPGTDFR